jgi:hypothetical protein
MNVYPTSARSYSIQLRNPQAVALVGVVLGGLFISFVIGYRSGKGVGYELALGGAASSVPRIPVAVKVPVTDEDSFSNRAPKSFSTASSKIATAPAVAKGALTKEASKPASVLATGAKVVEKTSEKSSQTINVPAVASPVANAELASAKVTTTASSEPLANTGQGAQVNNAAANVATEKPLLAPVEERLLADLMPKVAATPSVDTVNSEMTGQAPSVSAQTATTIEENQADAKLAAERAANSAKVGSDALKASGSSVPVVDAPIKAVAVDDKPTSTSTSPSAAELAKATNGRVVAKLPEGAKPALGLKSAAVPVKAPSKPVQSEQAAPAKVASSASSGNRVATGWYAQVGAPERLADAESVAKRLRGQGYPVVIENAQVRGAVYYRVLVGKSSSKEQAAVLMSRLQREKSLPAKPFVKYMK